MGARLAKAAEGTWRRLPPIPRLLLNHMALTAHDTHEDPQYWGGHPELVEFAMGKDLPADQGHKARCGCLVCRRRKSLFESLRRQLNVLIRAGAIEPLGPGLHGPNATYRLHVLHLSSGAPPLMGSGTTPDRVRGATPAGSRGIGERKETDEERRGGAESPEVTNSPGPVDGSRAPDQSPQPKLCPHGKPDVWHGINHGCRECRHEGR